MNWASFTTVLLTICGIYLLAGFLFALYFAFKGVGRIDPVAKEGSLGFRIFIIPGLCLFWPLFLVRVLRGVKAPPDEFNSHRREAGGGS